MTSTETPPARRIVVGTDGSESSIAALNWAAHQAALTGVALEVITTWEWPANYGWPVPVPDGYVPAADAAKLLDTLVADVRRDHPTIIVVTRVVEGHPAPVLVDASDGADLLVVGSRGHGEFVGMMLGSVSEHCVSQARCPVVVFRTR